MAENLVVNEVTYPEVEALSMTNEAGEQVGFYPDAVRYSKAQSLTDTQKAQARSNISAVGKSSLTLGVHADGLVYIFVDGEPVGTGVEMEVVGDVVGYIDADNNIVLTGDLAEGTYTVKYETSDGELLEIGELAFSSVAYTNLADPTSSDWKEGYRLSTSSGNPSALDGHTMTNFIPAKMGDVLRVKGLNITSYVSDKPAAIGIYNASKAYQAKFVYTGAGGASSVDAAKEQVSVSGDISTYTILKNNAGTQMADANTAYIRIDGTLMDGYTANDVIITINEEIA